MMMKSDLVARHRKSDFFFISCSLQQWGTHGDTATYRQHKEIRPWLEANLQCISQHIPGLRVCHLSPIFWLVNKKLLIIKIESQSEKKI